MLLVHITLKQEVTKVVTIFHSSIGQLSYKDIYILLDF